MNMIDIINTDITRTDDRALERLIYEGYTLLDDTINTDDMDDMRDQINNAERELDTRYSP